ncbi:MAG: 50S ribosomal protein L9 [Lachnospiraceae bacterium]|jgi:large subunit ribosomal protein L9|nr:50S ribosomal protein L9 [Lachnospiraceae bacterium]
MKLILLEDVKTLGKKGEIVEVKEGYARNLVVKKQAVEANNKNLNDLKLQNKNKEKIAEENLEAAKALAAKIGDLSVTCKIKAGEGGRTFGSVSTKEIAEAAKKQLDLEIDKKKMILDEPIRTLGVTEVTLKLHPQVNAVLRVKVVEE